MPPTQRNVEMVCKVYSQMDVDNPKYNSIELLGITKDKDISTENEIKINNQIYVVKYVIPSGKYYQILMEKK